MSMQMRGKKNIHVNVKLRCLVFPLLSSAVVKFL